MSERVCFLLQVKAGRVDEYLAAHADVWPEMLEALTEAGWGNYSLFLRESDGLVVGYLETEDFEASLAAMDSNEVNVRWQKLMAGFFEQPDGVRPDEGLVRLTEYFHLA